jgi:hypothetical protein
MYQRAPFLSRRTPLNFFASFVFLTGFFTAKNSPDFLLRLVHALAPPTFVFSCVRFFTAPLRALSPFGVLTAIPFSSLQGRDADHDRNLHGVPEFHVRGTNPASGVESPFVFGVALWRFSVKSQR